MKHSKVGVLHHFHLKNGDIQNQFLFFVTYNYKLTLLFFGILLTLNTEFYVVCFLQKEIFLFNYVASLILSIKQILNYESRPAKIASFW